MENYLPPGPQYVTPPTSIYWKNQRVGYRKNQRVGGGRRSLWAGREMGTATKRLFCRFLCQHCDAGPAPACYPGHEGNLTRGRASGALNRDTEENYLVR